MATYGRRAAIKKAARMNPDNFRMGQRLDMKIWPVERRLLKLLRDIGPERQGGIKATIREASTVAQPAQRMSFPIMMGGRGIKGDRTNGSLDREELVFVLWLRTLPPARLQAAAKAICDLTPQYGWMA